MRGCGQFVGHEGLRTHQHWRSRKKSKPAFPFMVRYLTTNATFYREDPPAGRVAQ